MKKKTYFPSQRIQLVYHKFQQLQKRISRAIDNGKFYLYTKAKQSKLTQRLHRYAQRLANYQETLPMLAKKGLATAALTGALFTTALQEGQAQTFVQEGGTIPFGLTDIGDNSCPAFADLNGDGAQDAFIGSTDGTVKYFPNSGSSTSPTFSQTTTGNPFSAVSSTNQVFPAFANIYNAGSGNPIDAVVGIDNILALYVNSGSTSVPSFSFTGTVSGFGSVSPSTNLSPAFVDINGDNLIDLFAGDANGDIFFLQNISSTSFPSFTISGTNPFGLANTGGNASPTFVDIDGDGDFDAFVGAADGTTKFYRNTGVSTAPTFALDSSISLPDVGTNAKPTFVDIDGDGDFDVFIGNGAGETLFFRNSPAVISKIQDDFNIADPCSCTDPQNATVNGTFLFHDVLTVTAPTGQAVQVIAPNDGKFLAANGTQITLPTTLTETATGVYQLDFWHRSGETTTVSVNLNGGTAMSFTSSLCNEANCTPIPTLNEWGLMILALLLLNLGLITVKQKEQLLASIEQKE